MTTYTSDDRDRAYYQITIKGQLAPHWSHWFDGMAMTYDSSGNTTLAGFVQDQSALYGLIAKARDLGLTLIGVALSEPPIAGGLLQSGDDSA